MYNVRQKIFPYAMCDVPSYIETHACVSIRIILSDRSKPVGYNLMGDIMEVK